MSTCPFPCLFPFLPLSFSLLALPNPNPRPFAPLYIRPNSHSSPQLEQQRRRASASVPLASSGWGGWGGGF
ncbi:hypothetical protein IWX47DRAFT_883059 [Phyllosticta citricarpa]